jgi:tripartite ATP-independent transporter DctP family solute receptor
MRKLLILSITILFICLLITPIQAEEIVLTAGHGHSIEHPYQIGYEHFKKIIEEETNGRIKVNIYPANQLGNEAEMTEQCKVGALDTVISGRFQATIPALEALGLPFLFRDYDHVERVFAGPIGQKYAEGAEKVNLVLLGYVHSGLRQITNNVRPIQTPADLKGLKLRCPPLEVILQTMKALGANVVPLPYSEVYMALKTGVVDGQENPYVNIYSEKFYEVQDYLTVCNYIYMYGQFWFSLSRWETLSTEDQKLIKKAALESCAVMNKEITDTEMSYKELIKKEGVQIYELTKEEKAAFIEKTASVYDWAIDQGYITEEIIQEIRNTK